MSPGVLRRLVVGGLSVSVERAPYVVRLYASNASNAIGFCGGTLVANETVLTAAHCVDVARDALYVGTFQNDIYASEAGSAHADLVRVTQVRLHPQYALGDPNAVVYGHDAALLTLERTPLLTRARSIALDDGTHWPADAETQPTDAAYVLGYGAQYYGGPQSLTLRAAHVHLYARTECTQAFGFVPAPSNLCAGLDGADACSGDSGGPLVVATEGAIVQVGIVSWGTGECGSAPGLYSLVGAARAFVETHAPEARFVAHASSFEEDACACTTWDACLSNGFDVSPRCGCAAHVAGDATTFCYVRHDGCANATYSSYVFGALWRTCTLPPPALPSPTLPPPTFPPPTFPPPTSPSPTLPPLAPPPETCDALRARHETLACCGDARLECISLRERFFALGCCD